MPRIRKARYLSNPQDKWSKRFHFLMATVPSVPMSSLPPTAESWLAQVLPPEVWKHPLDRRPPRCITKTTSKTSNPFSTQCWQTYRSVALPNSPAQLISATRRFFPGRRIWSSVHLGAHLAEPLAHPGGSSVMRKKTSSLADSNEISGSRLLLLW
jgi:hypothetical protein